MHVAHDTRYRCEVGLDGGDGILVRKQDVDVAETGLVELQRQLRPVDAQRGQQLVAALERLDRRNRLVHPAEDDAAGLIPLEGHRDDAHACLEPDLRQLQGPAQDEGCPQHRMPGKGQLRHRREDPDARMAVGLGRVHEHRLREVHLLRQPL